MNNFAILTIAYTHTETAILITNTTDNPCHLTCYYTDKNPLRHKTSRRERGIDLSWGAYFCFVAWKSVEQNEAGDTLSHTFTIPDWLGCQTKWLAFRGTVASILSPSVSPIFEHHHPYILQLTAIKDTHIIQYLPNNNYGTMTIFSIRDLNNQVIRTLLSFDLSSISLTATLSEAILKLYFNGSYFFSPSGKLVWIYKCNRPGWQEYEATWNIFKAANPWTNPGGDYETASPPGSSFNMPAAYGWVEINVITLVQDAITKGQNAHFLMKFDNETIGAGAFSVCTFPSREYVIDPELRPKLTINYT